MASWKRNKSKLLREGRAKQQNVALFSRSIPVTKHSSFDGAYWLWLSASAIGTALGIFLAEWLR